ncbi:hypothetical protein ACFFX0_08790 [Citricoccus parietis]|uniref:Uncharacterized protein n=1 Tax=Citricoccus parietis TaxID=592307 RepID=A0ABV5FX86_9MICC
MPCPCAPGWSPCWSSSPPWRCCSPGRRPTPCSAAAWPSRSTTP